MSEEERVFTFPNGAEVELFVSKIDNGKFRIEDLFRFAFFAEDVPGGVPEDAGFGSILEADELEDGRLRVKRVVVDPDIESLTGFGIPPDFPYSPEFEEFTAALLAIGGKWEVAAGGLFSAYAPRKKPEGSTFSLEKDINEALIEFWKRTRT